MLFLFHVEVQDFKENQSCDQSTYISLLSMHNVALKFLFKMFLTLQETMSLTASTETTAGISDTDRAYFGKQIRLLLMEVIKVRKQALAIGNTKFIGALNSYVKSLAKLMKVVKESAFDKQKVSNILRAIKKRVTLITADFEGKITTVASAKGEETTVPAGKVHDFLQVLTHSL